MGSGYKKGDLVWLYQFTRTSVSGGWRDLVIITCDEYWLRGIGWRADTMSTVDGHRSTVDISKLELVSRAS